MPNPHNVAIAIGVGDANPLPYLGGAVNGATAFHHWASKLGYDSRLVTDENQPVTLARLKSEIESLLQSQSDPIHRLLLYFAGHGLIREAEEGLWMLSDWKNSLRAVAVEVLKRRLYTHDIRQIAIFSDSCRSLPANMTAADLGGDPVLDSGPLTHFSQPDLDKFIAAQDGSAAFMVPGQNPSEDRCLFSGVLMEGLWGTKPEAFSKRVPGKITSQSLGTYLKTEVPKVAALYKHELLPTVLSSFPENDDFYVDSPLPTPPTFPQWPPANAISTPAGPTEECKGRGRIARDPRTGERIVVESTLASRLINMIRRQLRPDHFETGAGFVVDGVPVRDVWTPSDVVSESHGAENWWRLYDLSAFSLRKPVPVLIEFEDGVFATIVGLNGFIATVLRDGPGISALIYRRIGAGGAEAAEVALDKMESGSLRADGVADLALDFRQMEYADPVVGVLSAYLYDSIGDIDSIRRIAFYYAQRRQSIPYDIALLAALEGAVQDGMLWAHIPPVSEGTPRTDAERAKGWTHSATPAANGVVGGFWPWMRQGWGFLDDLVGKCKLVDRDLIDLSRHLKPGRFTTLDAEGGQTLAKVFGLRKQLVSQPI